MAQVAVSRRHLMIFTAVIALLAAVVLAWVKAACCLAEETSRFCFSCLLRRER